MKTEQKEKISALKKFSEDVIQIWSHTDQIKKLFAPNLSDLEFKFFMGMGISLKANPFKREIFAVKYGSEPATIIIARDFYRKKAQEQPDYRGHCVEAVYSFERFIPDPAHGVVQHSIDVVKRYEPENKPEPIGAYCIVYRENITPFYVFVPTKEYIKIIKDKQTGEKRRTRFWQEQTEMMIKKVAECQGLRGAYQGVLGGTYGEDEKNYLESAEAELIDETMSLEEKILNDKKESKKQKEPEKSLGDDSIRPPLEMKG